MSSNKTVETVVDRDVLEEWVRDSVQVMRDSYKRTWAQPGQCPTGRGCGARFYRTFGRRERPKSAQGSLERV